MQSMSTEKAGQAFLPEKALFHPESMSRAAIPFSNPVLIVF
jgi:hypothetical protein